MSEFSYNVRYINLIFSTDFCIFIISFVFEVPLILIVFVAISRTAVLGLGTILLTAVIVLLIVLVLGLLVLLSALSFS